VRERGVEGALARRAGHGVYLTVPRRLPSLVSAEGAFGPQRGLTGPPFIRNDPASSDWGNGLQRDAGSRRA